MSSPFRAADLTVYERSEIQQFEAQNAVFFSGRNLMAKVQATNNPLVYDDEVGHYRMVMGDHINYRYEIKSQLGKGSFGIVVRAWDHRAKRDVAIKVVKNRPAEHSASVIELQWLQRFAAQKNAPGADRVAMLLDHFIFRNHLCIVMELLYDNLWAFLKNNNFRLPIHVVKARSLLYPGPYMHPHR